MLYYDNKKHVPICVPLVPILAKNIQTEPKFQKQKWLNFKANGHYQNAQKPFNNSSKPVRGVSSLLGGFDSHILPPYSKIKAYRVSVILD